MKNINNILLTLNNLYEANDTYEPNHKKECETVEAIQNMMKSDNEFTEEDTKVWKREIADYQELKKEDDSAILTLIDNLIFYLTQPDEYSRVAAWRI